MKNAGPMRAAQARRLLAENPSERDWPEAGAKAARAIQHADAGRRPPPTGKTRWPKTVSSSSTPPARPQPALTNISAATCDSRRT